MDQTWSLYLYHRRFFSLCSYEYQIDWAELIHHSLYIVSFSYWQSPNPSSCWFLLLLSRSQFCPDHLAYQDLKTCLQFTYLLNAGINYIPESRMACSAALIFFSSSYFSFSASSTAIFAVRSVFSIALKAMGTSFSINGLPTQKSYLANSNTWHFRIAIVISDHTHLWMRSLRCASNWLPTLLDRYIKVFN